MKARNGIWQSDFYLSNGNRVRTSLGTRDKSLAGKKERELQVVMEAQLKGMALPPHLTPVTAHSVRSQAVFGMTLEVAFKRAMKEHEPWRASTSKTTINDNYKHVSAYFGADKDLAELTRDTMFEYVEKMRDEQELSGSTINQRLSLVSVLLTHAEVWTKGIVKPLKMPRQKVRKGRIRILSYDEEQKVTKWFKDSTRPRSKDQDMAELVPFLVDTGFRIGEALRLASSDIDWDNGFVPAWETKGDAPRQVPMTARVKAILKSRKHLTNPFGMFSVDSADDHWEKMRAGLKIDVEKDPEFVIHALRHTCASRLAANGEDAFRIQKWMGHKNIATTQKYVTLFGADLHSLARTLDARRLEVAKKASYSVPKSVPKLEPSGIIRAPRRPVGLNRRPASTGPRPETRTEATVGVGLLIRRSLVRAQVEEPALTGDTSEVVTNLLPDRAQECDQK